MTKLEKEIKEREEVALKKIDKCATYCYYAGVIGCAGLICLYCGR